MKLTIVFFGYSHQMRRWADYNEIDPRYIVMASNPHGLRGRTGDIRAVYVPGWYANASEGTREEYDLAHDHMQIILATGGTKTEEWA